MAVAVLNGVAVVIFLHVDCLLVHCVDFLLEIFHPRDNFLFKTFLVSVL